MVRRARLQMVVALLGACLGPLSSCGSDYCGCVPRSVFSTGLYTVYSAPDDAPWLLDAQVEVSDDELVVRYERDGWDYELGYTLGEWW